MPAQNAKREKGGRGEEEKKQGGGELIAASDQNVSTGRKWRAGCFSK